MTEEQFEHDGIKLKISENYKKAEETGKILKNSLKFTFK